MATNRRTFLRGSVGLTAFAAAATALANDPIDVEVLRELGRRKRFLSPPDGTPSDLEAKPSPPATPFRDELHVPGIIEPIVDMSGRDPTGVPYAELSDGAWWEQFKSHFAKAAAKLALDGIDIGALPIPEAHQRFFEFRPQKFFVFVEREFPWQFHQDYGGDSWSWGYEALVRPYDDAERGALRQASTPGPTFKARYGEPILVRRINGLPEIGDGDGNSRLRFALPSTTTHLHNAHTASESDGFPNDWINPGEYWDHHYGNFPSGHDEREKLATLWYHDHRMDFTAANVYAGLDGFYFLFDERDADDETKDGSWQLPSGKYDVPLILHDLLFAQDGSAAPQLAFDGFNTDGILGDRFTVNRKIQPRLKVEPRKYRFRLLNGGPSRFYELFLHTRDDALHQQFIVITGDGNFQPNPLLAESVYMGVAQRVDVIIDFSQFSPGEEIYLVNELEQTNGRGPSGRRIERPASGDVVGYLNQNAVMRFDVIASDKPDPSFFPLLFRELPPVDLTEVKRERVWEFDYDGGLWTINGNIYDPNRIDAGIEQDSAEIWTFRNTGNSWSHPIHSHFTEFIILEVNNRPHFQGTVQNDNLEGGRITFERAFANRETIRRELKPYRAMLQEVEEKSLSAGQYRETDVYDAAGSDEKLLFDAYANLPDSVKEKIKRDRYDEIQIGSYADYDFWSQHFPKLGIGDVRIERFMGGPRRDVALILPNWEVKVFMRWKDFLGKHVMHCHNVVHEDHAMMIRWQIVPKGRGFDTPMKARDFVRIAEQERPHVEAHPRRAVGAHHDADETIPGGHSDD